jgi:predicted RNase H-like nuclease
MPYTLIAGVVPVRNGWLVATGRLMGATMVVADIHVAAKFIDVLDARPSYQVITLHAPVGLPEGDEQGGRECDKAARKLLGWPRQAAIVSPPTREELSALTEAAPAPTPARRRRHRTTLEHAAEIDEAIAAYWQRTVYETNPELSFYELNSSRPLRYGKHSMHGQAERLKLLSARMGGVDRLVEKRLPRSVRRSQLIDSLGALWTARRIAGRAINSLPDTPQWDDQGRRMELVR